MGTLPSVIDWIAKVEPLLSVIDWIAKAKPLLAVIDWIANAEPLLAVIDWIAKAEPLLPVIDWIARVRPLPSMSEVFLPRETSHSLSYFTTLALTEPLFLSFHYKETPPKQGTKILQYCTCPKGQVTYSFHSSCKYMHLTFKSVGNMQSSSSYSSQSTCPTG